MIKGPGSSGVRAIEHSRQIAGNFGRRRAVYEIPREFLDDYFPHRPHLTDVERINGDEQSRSNRDCHAAEMRAGGLTGDLSRHGTVLVQRTPPPAERSSPSRTLRVS